MIDTTIKQIGGWPKEKIISLVDNGANLIIISVHKPNCEFVRLLEMELVPKITDPGFPEGMGQFLPAG